MDPSYARLIGKLEGNYSEFARKSTDCLGRKYPLKEDPFRTLFERDCHRILHSLPFRRLKHKTQVFFSPKDDHICTRLEHSLHVASVASTICRRLNLNDTLAQAIALAHDLGHPPFGHLGEKALARIHEEFNMKSATEKLPNFRHEGQSLRVIDTFRNRLHEPLNLTWEVRDGVVCHWGEATEQTLEPDRGKDLKGVEPDAALRRERPGTLEGCVVRMSDTISYLGRDFEDACMARLVTLEDLPEEITRCLGNTNTAIIGALIGDLVTSSRGKGHLQFSEEAYAALTRMKEFNFSRIYDSVVLRGQEERIYQLLSQLFEHFLALPGRKELPESGAAGQDYYNGVFAEFLKDMQYPEATGNGQRVSDFTAGMTDNFAMACFQDLFVVQRVV
ncbi:MAG: HD domain-containing protein [Chloroflexi bacterium]|nr:HD domain-containing protein [Chloroflexota bacterium]